ncbi:MAG TPA: electron transfer flavoprotein subunit alpha [Flavobacteriales bacterium]|nr:electron transfer flavoprotein subunit alpha [Flavobacteriales bacterium]HRE76119.1 electron transfer flavoprotein subunit alpha/FixB family protein [Flavobacteriales bacterium]HRE95768.1 electron transfer flavoprotein subunit alpha/FixB family protein [Flavobacteriales bacterium]HRJ35600.1 electron transfer flavoprotein subunit alpha/FixB family protein [Flavobacteriales bacterium]HRJ38721.1 electron transfer flavoprotein subunit alpha/FixB family protein [Flavobacteriales bacterium]
MSVLIFADTSNGKVNKNALEAASYGAKVASQLGTTATVITYGATANDALAAFGEQGVSKVLVNRSLSGADSQQVTRLVLAAAEKEASDLIVFSHDLLGRAVSPRVSARLNAGLVAGAIDYPETSGGFSVKVNLFSGKAYGFIEVHSAKKVISILPNSLGLANAGGSAVVEDFAADCGTAAVCVKEVKKNEGEIALPEAEMVVSAGRGMKGPEHWGIIEELAKELGAATACSRPVADIGWRPHHEHVGQTGIAIAPNLYIAVGISGAIQHLAGVNRSKVIVVVNTDPEAPFFKAADYGIVGDAFQVVPQITEALKKHKAAQH